MERPSWAPERVLTDPELRGLPDLDRPDDTDDVPTTSANLVGVGRRA